MPAPAPFALTTKLLARHGFAGRVLALPPSAVGGMVQLLGDLPGGAGVPWAYQGRRPDARVWAPLVERVKPKAGPDCESCGGSGKCAQCSGIGCAVCNLTGKCAVCGGAGVVERAPDSDDYDDEESSSNSPMVGAPIVRVVSVRGVLASEVTPWECGIMDGYQGPGGIVDRWRQAHADPAAVAVVLDAMAPGGDALLCMESAAEMAASTRASGKPAYVFASEATSAMYALACAAASPGGFYAAPSGDVGSIGTRTWHVDRSGQNKQDGIVVTHIGNPSGKILGNPDQPLADEALKRIQDSIDETSARFFAHVAAMRGMSAEDAAALDARCLRGQPALDAKLIDGIAASLADVVALAYGRSVALANPTITAGPAGDEDEDMKLSPAALQALGLQPGAKSADIEAAILARPQPIVATLDTTAGDPLRSLGALALEALGGGDALEAMVALPRKLAAAADAPVIVAERDELRRERAWATAITAGSFSAGEVWAQTTDAEGKRAKTYTRMAAEWNAAYPDVEKLEQRLAKMPKLARGNDRSEADADLARAADEQRQAVGLSPRWLALAAKSGVNPAALATRAAQNLGHISTETT